MIWGDGIRGIIEKLFKHEFHLQNALSSYLENMNPDNHEKVEYDRKIIYDTLNENDEFRIEIMALIKEAESFLKPKLKLY